mmetsp:Transcript_47996/g.114072  ORF Transcript_47996/g.114072 Transcript_47996/m.114072 type:complete len:168 (+) Transcript_47996:1296-1799(+)
MFPPPPASTRTETPLWRGPLGDACCACPCAPPGAAAELTAASHLLDGSETCRTTFCSKPPLPLLRMEMGLPPLAEACTGGCTDRVAAALGMGLLRALPMGIPAREAPPLPALASHMAVPGIGTEEEGTAGGQGAAATFACHAWNGVGEYADLVFRSGLWGTLTFAGG